MQVVFLILVHKNPGQTIRLIERLAGPRSKFVVHVDLRSPVDVYPVIATWAANRTDVTLCTTRHRCYWADFGIVAGTLECVRTALKSGDKFDYAMLISGQDYPIKPLDSIFDDLDRNAGKQFIESFRLDDTKNRWARHGGQFRASARYSWYVFRFRSRRFPVPLCRSLPAGLKPCGGSQWWCLSRDALEFICAYLDSSPKAFCFFKYVSVPDETVFQTVLYSSPFQGAVHSDDMRYVDWTRPNPTYPRVLDEDDIGRLRVSPKWFARKFDVSRGTGILDLIDRELLGRLPQSATLPSRLARRADG